MRKKNFFSKLDLNCIKLNTFSSPETKSKGPAAESRCSGRACNPRMGNLALGRVLGTQSVCGSNFSEPYCFYKQTAAPRIRETCSAAKCGKCNSAVPSQAHPPSAMSDSSFRYPDTWWQSAEGAKEETLQLDLETEFLFTHLILVFRSPRPAAMVLERSQDHGHTWKTLRYFARDCEEVFGLAEGSPVGESGATCTSKYSNALPCARGEVSTITLHVVASCSEGVAWEGCGWGANKYILKLCRHMTTRGYYKYVLKKGYTSGMNNETISWLFQCFW